MVEGQAGDGVNVLRYLIYGLVGRCSHPTLSRVFTDPVSTRSYVVCFKCAAHLSYDLKQMRIVASEPAAASVNQEQFTECRR